MDFAGVILQCGLLYWVDYGQDPGTKKRSQVYEMSQTTAGPLQWNDMRCHNKTSVAFNCGIQCFLS